MKVTAPEQFGSVGVLMGGSAAERDVSLVSGQAVYDALKAQGVNVVAIDIKDNAPELLINEKLDRVFNVLHGRGGEDGVIQGLLETMGLPYTGSGVMGSAVSMDKYRTKLLWQGLGLPTPGFALIASTQDVQAAAELGFPLMVKPVHEGSSIGMAFVEDVEGLEKACKSAAEFDSLVMAEQWINGKEYTASILADQVLPMIRLQSANQFYDYQAKYELDTTQYHVPCGLDQQTEQRFADLAKTAFDATGASGWGRVDLMVDEEGNPWFIEVNSVPGMTSHSLVPMAANAIGIDFKQLVWKILEQTVA
jgi:D-alanine-D-alanine ligase